MDKNPKHPLKKKKAHEKVNVADHSSEEQVSTGKHKKHVYEQRAGYASDIMNSINY